MSDIQRRSRRDAVAILLLAVFPGILGAATAPLAACAPLVDDRGERGACVCAIEGSETPLSHRDYAALLTERRRSGVIAALELAALLRAARQACGSSGGFATHTEALRPPATPQSQREANQ